MYQPLFLQKLCIINISDSIYDKIMRQSILNKLPYVLKESVNKYHSTTRCEICKVNKAINIVTNRSGIVNEMSCTIFQEDYYPKIIICLRCKYSYKIFYANDIINTKIIYCGCGPLSMGTHNDHTGNYICNDDNVKLDYNHDTYEWYDSAHLSCEACLPKCVINAKIIKINISRCDCNNEPVCIMINGQLTCKECYNPAIVSFRLKYNIFVI